MYKIKLKNNKEFDCDSSTTVLKAALNQGINLEYSCLSARCRSCKVQVVEGTYNELEKDTILTEEEKSAGFVLSCNIVPCSDMKLEAEVLEVDLPKKQIVPAKISKISYLKEDVIELIMRMPPKTEFNFLAGQFVNIQRGNDKRSYSIANLKNNENTLTFLIRNYQGGVFSKYWFEDAKENDLLRIEGPMGTFFYRENTTSENVVLLATGTGIAPIKAMLEQFSQETKWVQNKKVWLFWGGRKKEDLFLDFSFEGFSFQYIPVLSREENWSGEKGYIQNIALKQNIDWKTAEVYACGSPNMIETSRKVLVQNGLREELFFSDPFVSTN